MKERATIQQIYDALVSGDVDNFKRTLVGWSREEVHAISVIKQYIGAESLSNSDHFYGLLHRAAGLGNLEIVEWLLNEYGVPVNQLSFQGATALHAACYSRHAAVVKCLVQRGANIDLESQSSLGSTPIEQVVTAFSKIKTLAIIASGYLDIIEYLIQRGANTAILSAGSMRTGLDDFFGKVLATNRLFTIFHCLETRIPLSSVSRNTLISIEGKIRERLDGMSKEPNPRWTHTAISYYREGNAQAKNEVKSLLMLRSRPRSPLSRLPRFLAVNAIGNQLGQEKLRDCLRVVKTELASRRPAAGPG